MSVYIASSWRNPWLDLVNHELRAAGIETYDFREHDGFHWQQVFPEWGEDWPDKGAMPPHMLKTGLAHELAERGFGRDRDALDDCSALIAVQPCGNSAHLELGYVAGAGKPTAILLPPDGSPMRPDLMWKVAQLITPELGEVIAWSQSLDRLAA